MILYDNPLKIELKHYDLFVNGHKHDCSIRKLQKMKDVLFSHVEPISEDDFNLYYMYRSVYSNIEMRFDITVLPPKMLGQEFNKTYGHYHTIAEQNLAYPEVYQVLNGSAIFLLQQKNSDGTVNSIAVSAKARDVVIIPSNFGHVSINPSKEEDLVMSNVVFNGFESIYEDYALNKGAAYYYTEEGFLQNTNYLVKNFKKLTAAELNNKYGFFSDDILLDFVKDPEKFRFLEKPSLLFKP